MTKGKAFWLCLASVMFIFTAMFIAGVVKTDLDIIPVAACLTAIGSLAGIYIAGSVTDSGVKGKCWNQQMFNSLHEKEVTSGPEKNT